MENLDLNEITESNFTPAIAEQLAIQGQKPRMEEAIRGIGLNEQKGIMFHYNLDGSTEKHLWLPETLAKKARRAIDIVLQQ